MDMVVIPLDTQLLEDSIAGTGERGLLKSLACTLDLRHHQSTTVMRRPKYDCR